MAAPNCKIFPAAKYIAAQEKAHRLEIFRAWQAGVSNEYLLHFIEKGLRPFCEAYGYKLLKEDHRVLKCIRAWAFAHVWVARNSSKTLYINYGWSENDGYEEAYEWYRSRIDTDEWMKLADLWQMTEFCDTSDVGIRQRDDLLECVWRLLDLNGSPEHSKFLASCPYDDSDEEYGHIPQQEESAQAFGGDRRTL